MSLTRRPDWEERLTDLNARSFGRQFRYGDFDCLLYVCEGIAAMTDVDLSLRLRGQYVDELGAGLAIRHAGFADVERLVEAMAARHGIPEIPPALATRGDIAMAAFDTRTAFGICIGEEMVCAGEDGIELMDIADCRRAWKIG